MWRYVLLLGIAIASPTFGRCDTLQFTVDPANTGIVYPGPKSVGLFSTGLNGTMLAGQTQSLDLVLSNDVLARLGLSDPGGFGVEFEVFTNAGKFPGFAGPSTGFLLDPSVHQFGDTQDAGRAGCSCGSFVVGLVSFTPGNLEGANGVDISGIHFNITFPDTGYVVTNGELIISLNSPSDSVEFGTAQQLPEPSSLLLLGSGLLGLTGLLAVKSRIAPKHANVCAPIRLWPPPTISYL